VLRPRSLASKPRDERPPVEALDLVPTWRRGRLLFTVVRIDCAEECEGPELALVSGRKDVLPVADPEPAPVPDTGHGTTTPRPPSPPLHDDGD
jgi:hypothetical protein